MASIGKIKLKLSKLQKWNKKTRKFKATIKLQEDWENIDRVLHY